MKGKIIIFLLVLVLSVALAACNDGGTKTPASDGDGQTAQEGDGTDGSAFSGAKPDIKPEKTDVTIGTLNSTAHLFAFVADKEGFFAEEGLTATVTPFASSGELVAGLESDKLDVAFIGSVPTITNQSTGHDITIFGGAMTNGHGYVIKKDLIKDGQKGDISVLKGKNIATTRPSVQDLELLILLKEAGIEYVVGDPDKDPKTTTIVYFESQKEAFNALDGAQIDAASIYSPYGSIAKNKGYEVVYHCNDVKAFENQPCCRQVAATSQLADRPQTYLAIERALIKAWKFSQQNREKTIEDVKAYIDLEPADLEFEIYGGYGQSHPDPDKIATTAVKQQVLDVGYIESDYEGGPFYNTEIYKQAVESLVAEFPDDEDYAGLLQAFSTRN